MKLWAIPKKLLRVVASVLKGSKKILYWAALITGIIAIIALLWWLYKQLSKPNGKGVAMTAVNTSFSGGLHPADSQRAHSAAAQPRQRLSETERIQKILERIHAAQEKVREEIAQVHDSVPHLSDEDAKKRAHQKYLHLVRKQSKLAELQAKYEKRQRIFTRWRSSMPCFSIPSIPVKKWCLITYNYIKERQTSMTRRRWSLLLALVALIILTLLLWRPIVRCVSWSWEHLPSLTLKSTSSSMPAAGGIPPHHEPGIAATQPSTTQESTTQQATAPNASTPTEDHRKEADEESASRTLATLTNDNYRFALVVGNDIEYRSADGYVWIYVPVSAGSNWYVLVNNTRGRVWIGKRIVPPTVEPHTHMSLKSPVLGHGPSDFEIDTTSEVSRHWVNGTTHELYADYKDGTVSMTPRLSADIVKYEMASGGFDIRFCNGVYLSNKYLGERFDLNAVDPIKPETITPSLPRMPASPFPSSQREVEVKPPVVHQAPKATEPSASLPAPASASMVTPHADAPQPAVVEIPPKHHLIRHAMVLKTIPGNINEILIDKGAYVHPAIGIADAVEVERSANGWIQFKDAKGIATPLKPAHISFATTEFDPTELDQTPAHDYYDAHGRLLGHFHPDFVFFSEGGPERVVYWVSSGTTWKIADGPVQIH